MNTIAKIISFPIALIILVICILFVLLFSWDIIKEAKTKDVSFQVASLRILRETKNLYLYRIFERNPIFSAFLSIIIYYFIFK